MHAVPDTTTPVVESPPLNRTLGTVEAVAYCRTSRATLLRLAQEGRITRYYFGGRLRFDMRELDALLTRREAS